MADLLVIMLVMYIGLLASVIVPYFRKKKETKITAFDMKFLWHSIGAAVWEFLAAITLYASWNPPEDLISEGVVLLLAFIFGYGGLEAQKQAEKVLRVLLPLFKRERIMNG